LPTQTKTLANGEVWELHDGQSDWHIVEQSYQELYGIALLKVADDPLKATKVERARAQAIVEAYFRGSLDRERIIRDQQESYDRSFLPKAQ
jgi:hypothetical protein